MAFCPTCGKELSDLAPACPACGQPRTPAMPARAAKDKTVAILLAVFLSFWTWLYTYQRDATKFWIGLPVSIVGFFLVGLPALGIWIWAIVDTATKDQSWYVRYPSV